MPAKRHRSAVGKRENFGKRGRIRMFAIVLRLVSLSRWDSRHGNTVYSQFRTSFFRTMLILEGGDALVLDRTKYRSLFRSPEIYYAMQDAGYRETRNRTNLGWRSCFKNELSFVFRCSFTFPFSDPSILKIYKFNIDSWRRKRKLRKETREHVKKNDVNVIFEILGLLAMRNEQRLKTTNKRPID